MAFRATPETPRNHLNICQCALVERSDKGVAIYGDTKQNKAGAMKQFKVKQRRDATARRRRDRAATARLDKVMGIIGDDPASLIAVIALMDCIIARRSNRKIAKAA